MPKVGRVSEKKVMNRMALFCENLGGLPPRMAADMMQFALGSDLFYKIYLKLVSLEEKPKSKGKT